jgi:hypothetical protein
MSGGAAWCPFLVPNDVGLVNLCHIDVLVSLAVAFKLETCHNVHCWRRDLYTLYSVLPSSIPYSSFYASLSNQVSALHHYYIGVARPCDKRFD